MDMIEIGILLMVASLFIVTLMIFLCPVSGEDYSALAKKMDEDFKHLD